VLASALFVMSPSRNRLVRRVWPVRDLSA